MKQFNFVIRDELGIHARPAGQLAKMLKPFKDTTVTVTKGDQTVKVTQLIKLMHMKVKKGAEVTVAAEGPEEDAVIEMVNEFFQKNL